MIPINSSHEPRRMVTGCFSGYGKWDRDPRSSARIVRETSIILPGQFASLLGGPEWIPRRRSINPLQSRHKASEAQSPRPNLATTEIGVTPRELTVWWLDKDQPGTRLRGSGNT